jgi:tRNA-splicing ligase RtcB (3'-phosphate/5'-hydroxy nucleic acid ligase)
VLSRHAAKKLLRGVNLVQALEQRGIIVRCQNPRALGEEASEAYKDVSSVVDVLEHAGIARNVARTRPLAVIKG